MLAKLMGQFMKLTEILNVRYPIIMAPMFLVSNDEMMLAADEAGIAGCMPALNVRPVKKLRETLKAVREKRRHSFGVNLIVNKSNFGLSEQLQACLDAPVDFIITSLGSPKEVIEKCRAKGIKVFCDVTDLSYAQKVESMGADALIAVNSGAGGHAGKIPATILIPLLKKKCSIPVISAGGVATADGIKAMQALGADGLSIGSPFIASTESPVSQGYKQAIVDYGAKDIVMTTKLSGTPCTVIKTPYVEKIGTEENLIEKALNSNKKLKKWVKGLTFYKGMKLLEKAAFSSTYQSVWCAGPSIEFVDAIQPTADIVKRLTEGVEFKKS